MGKVLLFYKYITLQYPKQIFKWQTKICTELGLKGRVILGHEGINATLGGSVESVEAYKALMQQDPLFADIDFKESEGDESCFPRLQIKIRDEIVRLGLDPKTYQASDGGRHMTPQETHELYQNMPDDVVVFDARNRCEWEIGAFEGAIKPDIKYFRDLPAYIDQNQDLLKDKRVLMYCTGGIRCERASAYVKSKGIAKEVMQMEGGIHRYVEQYPEGHFKGKNYVFDARLAVKANEELLGTCLLCSVTVDTYTNCLNAVCNRHYICCDSCKVTFQNTCGSVCQELLASRKVHQRPPLHTVSINLNEHE